jgi:hypothetical protein
VKTYAERKIFTRDQLALLAWASDRVSWISAKWELARAVWQLWHVGIGAHNTGAAVIVIDGKYGPVEHSWLRCHNGTVLDVYVPGQLPSVQLVDSMMSMKYVAGKPRTDIDQKIVQQLIKEMSKL